MAMANIYLLSELTCLRFEGQDSEKFLQGQLTNDVTQIGDTLMVAGYCNAQGRLLAVFRLFKDADAFCAITQRDGIETLIRRLRMYVLRSRVTVTLMESPSVYGLTGEVSDGEFPGLRILTDGISRFAIGHCDQARTDASEFWFESVSQGAPWLPAGASELFTPMSLNLDLTGGVSFTKGCYIGQEIVGRMHFHNKIARRSFVYTGECEELEAGEDLFNAEGTPVARVVKAVRFQSKTAVCAECLLTVLCDTLYTKNKRALVRQNELNGI